MLVSSEGPAAARPGAGPGSAPGRRHDRPRGASPQAVSTGWRLLLPDRANVGPGSPTACGVSPGGRRSGTAASRPTLPARVKAEPLSVTASGASGRFSFLLEVAPQGFGDQRLQMDSLPLSPRAFVREVSQAH